MCGMSGVRLNSDNMTQIRNVFSTRCQRGTCFSRSSIQLYAINPIIIKTTAQFNIHETAAIKLTTQPNPGTQQASKQTNLGQLQSGDDRSLNRFRGERGSQRRERTNSREGSRSGGGEERGRRRERSGLGNDGRGGGGGGGGVDGGA